MPETYKENCYISVHILMERKINVANASASWPKVVRKLKGPKMFSGL